MGIIGIGVIGCGHWGINHIRVFSELPESRVVAACDLRPERLEVIRQRFPEVTVTTSSQDLLRMDDIEAVIVCTDATRHHEVVSDCLDAGKHVLVEKPMTTRVSRAKELIARAEARELKLMVGHIFLYNSGVRKVKSYITQGEAGQVYYLYSRRTNLGPVRRDVNAPWDLAPHDVSIFNFLLDSRPTWVSAVCVDVLGEGLSDTGFLCLGYPNGVLGHIHVSWADPHKVREIVVVGSERRIAFDDLSAQEPVRVFERGIKPVDPQLTSYGEFQFLMRDGDIIIPRVEMSEPLKNQSRHFLECLVNGHRPLTDGQNGLEVVRVMEAIDRSASLRGAPVEITWGEE